MRDQKILKSGEFLVRNTKAQDIFISEEFNEEQLMIADTFRSFIETEVKPNLNALDKGDRELMKSLLKKSGEFGLMGISIPEEFGGFGQDFVTQMLAAEMVGTGYSFSVAFMAHCGIGTLPIMYYGNDEQRLKYVTKLASGEFIGAYCLTEPGAGSDANSGKTGATLSADGIYYILNGQKMWITNAGFADIQVVFAKIDNDRVLSAFIVESNWPGVIIGQDEHKMGIKGSSTAQIYYNDVNVPVENLIGSRGEGYRIALSILHMGRMKLGANVIGAAKQAITQSVQYANERKQFGSLISTFGAIKHKLAEMVIRTFAHESATYRVSKDIDVLLEEYKQNFEDYGRASIEAISHFAVEDAILKVYGSEVLDYIVDEGVQIHGGMGYSAEMEIERAYRDSRINRIFEGTNEINRLLVSNTAMKRAMKGDFDLFGEAEKILAEQDFLCGCKLNGLGYYEEKHCCLKSFKKIAVLLSNTAYKTIGKQLVHDQEVMNNITDIISELYIGESLALRVEKLEGMKDVEAVAVYRDMLDVFIFDAASKIRKWGLDAAYTIHTGEEAEKYASIVKSLCCVKGVNVKNARRRIADKLIEDNMYKF
ncbi:MAG: acyl-CoA dehydrogenase family protein [Bacteroidales bacterium]|nr:acyl-CoA dehydrogenase family protein [Bacteroidales bacterium]MDZ4203925.1 acyl-CoA dehydrogenase family protein [Bacteroidales bacterium]